MVPLHLHLMVRSRDYRKDDMVWALLTMNNEDTLLFEVSVCVECGCEVHKPDKPTNFWKVQQRLPTYTHNMHAVHLQLSLLICPLAAWLARIKQHPGSLRHCIILIGITVSVMPQL